LLDVIRQRQGRNPKTDCRKIIPLGLPDYDELNRGAHKCIETIDLYSQSRYASTVKVKRIAVYGRVSTDGQNHYSQLREVRAYVRRRWPKGEVTEYLDKASGAKFKREGLDAMMTEVRKDHTDIIAVYKLDRLGRSLQHLAQLLGEFEAHRTALIATSQGIDTSETNPAGRLQMHVLAAVAEFERSVIRERIDAGLAAARERGAQLGRPRTLHKHRDAVKKLMKRGLSGRRIAAKLKIPVGSIFYLINSIKHGLPAGSE
jgi:DNA invertase Pin-like site-specific DNA recombinase